MVLALAAAITLQYVSWKLKRQDLNIQLVGFAWLATILVILAPMLR